jgi:uncharacterized membrane protein (UPF0127 family)
MFVTCNNKQYPAEIMTTPEEITQGMMGRTELNGCMVFNMGMGHHSFWMKGCLIPLDIVFVSKNRITRIHHDCQPQGNKLTPKTYTGIGDYVIEFPSGTCQKWSVGDRINIIQEKGYSQID